MQNLKNKVVIITGSSKGIGEAAVYLFSNEGAKIVVVGRDQKEVDQVVANIRKNKKEAIGFAIDIRCSDRVNDMIVQVIKKWKRIDVLVNNAAVITWDKFLDKDLGHWNDEIDINLKALIQCSYLVGQQMLKQKDGVMVNVSSQAGKVGFSGLSVYCATKFGVLGFTEAFSQEVEKEGIRVYAVCPGPTKTQMSDFYEKGMPPEKVAKRILETARETLGLKPGDNTEIYS